MARFPIEAVTENNVKRAKRNAENVRRAMKNTGKSAYELFDELMETVEYVRNSFNQNIPRVICRAVSSSLLE